MNTAAHGLSIVAIVVFVVPLALSASPAGAQTSTTAATVSTTTTTPTTTTASTTSSTTTTTHPPTSTTASPPVTGQGIVVIGANGNTIHVEGAVDVVQTADQVLPLTGSSSMPVVLTGIVSVVSGALASTFKRRRRFHR